jgi:hypothetical protein
MNNRAIAWCGTLSDRVLEGDRLSFSREEILAQSDLFAHRAALFYTPTLSIPDTCVGEGRLDVTLPIATHDYTEAIELRTPGPRFWVDLIQRQTFRIRWRPFSKARIRYTRFDYYAIRDDHFISGTKALTDALKERPSGRTDGKWLYYFGAIVDDGPAYTECEWKQNTIDHPGQARIRVEVDAL